MGGRLTVVSQLSVGSTFTLHLQFAKGEDMETGPGSHPPVPLVTNMNEHILIVEDEQELCMTLGDRLRSEGYAVECAFDGRSGFEKMNQVPFDLVILDLMLPMRSGLDLCVDIRRSGFTTPILILTALASPWRRWRG